MSQRIARRENGQSERCCHRLLHAASVAQRPNQPMVGLDMSGIHRNSGTEGFRGLGRRPGGKQIARAPA